MKISLARLPEGPVELNDSLTLIVHALNEEAAFAGLRKALPRPVTIEFYLRQEAPEAASIFGGTFLEGDNHLPDTIQICIQDDSSLLTLSERFWDWAWSTINASLFTRANTLPEDCSQLTAAQLIRNIEVLQVVLFELGNCLNRHLRELPKENASYARIGDCLKAGDTKQIALIMAEQIELAERHSYPLALGLIDRLILKYDDSELRRIVSLKGLWAIRKSFDENASLSDSDYLQSQKRSGKSAPSHFDSYVADFEASLELHCDSDANGPTKGRPTRLKIKTAPDVAPTKRPHKLAEAKLRLLAMHAEIKEINTQANPSARPF